MADQKAKVEVLHLLRALAAVMVCAYHFLWHEDPWGKFLPDGSALKDAAYFGSEGVYVFFVISGFIIPYALIQSKYKLSDYPRFVLKRFLRLHPPYLLSMMLSGILVLIYAIWYWQPFEIEWQRIAEHFVFLVPWGETVWFNAVYWTLAIEFQYYLIIALLFPLLMRSKWLMHLVLLSLAVAALGFEDKRIMLHFAPVFLLGLVVLLWKKQKLNAFLALFWALFALWSIRYYISPYTAITSGLTTLIVAFFSWRSKFTDWMGEISYSLYLTHTFSGGQFLWFTSRYAHTLPQKLALFLTAVIISLLFAWLFWRIIEVPSMAWASKIKYRRNGAE